MIHVQFKHRYKIAALLVLILQLLFATGCWDLLELNKRAIVVGLGFDSSPNEDKILISVQIIDPSNIKTPQTAGGGDGQPYWIATNESTTVFEGMRAMTHVSSRKLFFPHNQIIIFGEDLAKKGIKDYLDLLMRDYEFRETNWIIVSEGKAQDILDTKTRVNNISAFFIRDLITERKFSSQAMAINIKDLARKITSKSTAPIASYIYLENTGQEKRLNLSRTAVFDNNMNMVGTLNNYESRGLLWVLGEVKSGIIVVESPNGKGNYSLEILKVKSKIIPEFKDGKPTITVRVKESSNLGETSCLEDLTKPEVWELMESLQNEAIHQEISITLDKAQELKADIFGFGEAFHKKYPRRWKEMEPNWQEIFSSLEVNIIVESKVKNPGVIIKKVFSEKGD
ncbi:MAG: Ger(x)C family spore germination protein [Desulfitobacteriaceae bacterium]|nr:Ger(x)C family spore germination protein [Desulfitobacteriaceae bacterium]